MGALFSKKFLRGQKQSEYIEYEPGSWRVSSDTDLKIVVCGTGGVGKSAFSIQFVSNHFVETYDPTIEDSYRKQIQVDDKVSMLEILDTAGQEEFSAMRDQWFRTGDGFILMYSVTNHDSFREVEKFRQMILRSKEAERGPMVLVGNKCDLEADRDVTTQEGQELADKFKIPFLEASAKTRLNVDEAFFELVRYCRKNMRGAQKR